MGDTTSGPNPALVSGGPPPRATSSGLFDISLSGVRRSLSSLLKNKYPIVRIGDEDVIMDEVAISPERAIHYGKIGFHKAFFPGLEEGDALEEKRQSFKKVFAEASLFKKREQPLPPCNAADRKNILEGLSNRIDQLSNEILTMSEATGDIITSELTGAINRLTTLKTLEATFLKNEENRQCIDYDQGTDAPSLLTKEGMEDNDKMRVLLRQFAILMLQAEQPLEEYEHLKDSVDEMTQLLAKTGFDQKDADEYIDLWRKTAKASGQGVIMPPVLSETLDVTDTQQGVVVKTVSDNVEALYRGIINSVTKIFSEAGNEEIAKEWRDKLEEAADLDSMSKLNKLFNDISQMAKSYQGLKTELQNKLKESEERYKELSSDHETKKAKLEEQQVVLAGIEAKLKEAEDSATGATAKVVEAVAQLEAQKRVYEEGIAATQDKISEQEAALAAAATEKEGLQNAVAAAAAAAASSEAAKADAEARAIAAEGEKAAAAAGAAALAAEIEALKGALKEAGSNVAQLESLTALTREQTDQLAAAKAEAARLQQLLAGKEGELAKLAARIQPLEAELAALNTQLAAARAESQSLKTTLATNEKALQDKVAEVTRKQNETNGLKASLQENMNLIKQLRAGTEELKKASANKNSNIKVFEQKEAEFLDKIANLNGEILTREEDINALNKEIIALKTTSSENKKKLDSQVKTISELKAARTTAEETLKQLKESSVLKGDVKGEIDNLRQAYKTTPTPSAYDFKYFRDDRLLRQPFLNLFLNASKTISSQKAAEEAAKVAERVAKEVTAAAQAATAKLPRSSSTVPTATGAAPAMAFSMDYSDAALLRRPGTAAAPGPVAAKPAQPPR